MSSLLSLRVTRYREPDLPRILRIERACFGADAYSRTLFREWRRTPGSIFLVARSGMAIAGYILGRAEAGGGEIVSIAVASRFRRKGVGRALMAHLLGRLCASGAVHVDLVVRTENEAAIRLYRSFGFRCVRLMRGYYEDGGDGWWMRR